jgi:hypothetical protein
MTDERDPPGPLAPGSAALLESWLQSRARPRSAMPEPAALVRYLTGRLPAEEARAVERGLVASTAARRRVRDVGHCLEALKEGSWEEAAARAQGEGLEAEAAREWLRLAGAQVGAAAGARRRWRAAGWNAVRREVAEGAVEAQAAWAALGIFGQRLRALLDAPRLATARGVQAGLVVAGSLPPGTRLVVARAEADAEGALRIALAAEGEGGAEWLPVRVALGLGSETWPLAAGVIRRGRASWELPGLAAALGLAAGPLPPSCLRVSVGPEAAAEAGGPPWSLLVPVVDAAGAPRREPPAAVELLSAPRWEAGEFRVEVALPLATRVAWPEHVLELRLGLSPRWAQRLGEWPVREWGAGPRVLTVACPGAPDAEVPLASLLRARLRPPGGER